MAFAAGWRQNAGPPVSQLNGGNRVQKVLKPIKKLFKQAKENPIIAIPVAVFAVLVVGVLVAFAVLGGGGGDDGGNGRHDEAKEDEESSKKDPAIEKAKKRKVKPAPVVSGSRHARHRAQRRHVRRRAGARARSRTRRRISVRVSAAPKQKVTVDYQLACYRDSGTKIGKGSYTPRPPDVRNLPLPISGAKECTVTVGAQLTSTAGAHQGRDHLGLTTAAGVRTTIDRRCADVVERCIAVLRRERRDRRHRDGPRAPRRRRARAEPLDRRDAGARRRRGMLAEATS